VCAKARLSAAQYSTVHRRTLTYYEWAYGRGHISRAFTQAYAQMLTHAHQQRVSRWTRVRITAKPSRTCQEDGGALMVKKY